jgi:hypothetical protein
VVDGGSTICISADQGSGTYCFDTRSNEWWKAGDWMLPFFVRADHTSLSSLDTWLGFRYFLDPK